MYMQIRSHFKRGFKCIHLAINIQVNCLFKAYLQRVFFFENNSFPPLTYI